MCISAKSSMPLQTEKEADNYGLYLPSSHGRPGKFLDEERLLTDYALQGHVPQLEFRYRCRDFMSVPGMTEKQIVKANTKVIIFTVTVYCMYVKSICSCHIHSFSSCHYLVLVSI